MRRKVSSYLRKRIVKQFLLFMGLAFVFLIFSKLSNDYKQSIQIQINLSNVNEDIVVKNDSNNVVNAVVQAKGFALVPFILKDKIELEFDSKADMTSTQNYFVFDILRNRYLFENKLGSSYKIVSLRPDSLLIPYARMASKNVPLNIISDLEFALGYDLLDDLSSDTDSIKVVGPEEVISAIEEVSTEELNLDNIKEDIKQGLSINLDKIKNADVFPKTVQVTGTVKRFTEGTLEVPVIITNQPESVKINYFPKTVTIAFYVDLEQYNAVKNSDFIVECEFPNEELNSPFLLPKLIKKPDFVKRASIKQKRLDFIRI